MTSEDAPRFAVCISALAVATRTELDDPTIELYYNALEEIPIDLLEAAAIELAKSTQFFPKPAEWRTAVDAILDRQDRLEAGQRRALPPGAQAQLPGGIGEAWTCPDCEGTGFKMLERICDDPRCPALYRRKNVDYDNPRHVHREAVRCPNTECQQRREAAHARRRRYTKGD